MHLPGIFCAISLLLCGLYPVAMGALPSPRSPTLAQVAPDPEEIRREAILVEVSDREVFQEVTALARSSSN